MTSYRDRSMTRPATQAGVTDEAVPTSGSRSATAWSVPLWVALGAVTGVVAIGGSDFRSVTGALPLTALSIPVLSYLAAAAFGRREIGWLSAGTLSVLVVVAELVDVPRPALFLVTAAVLMTVGLVLRPALTVPQTLAMIGFLGVAVLGLLFWPRVGLAIAGIALAAHAVWDVVHYRRDAVVNRSLALWCIGLDVVVGVACVAAVLAT